MALNIPSSFSSAFDSVQGPQSEDSRDGGAQQLQTLGSNISDSFESPGDALARLSNVFGGDGIGSGTRANKNLRVPETSLRTNNSQSSPLGNPLQQIGKLEQRIQKLEIQSLEQEVQGLDQQLSSGGSASMNNRVAGGSDRGGTAGSGGTATTRPKTGQSSSHGTGNTAGSASTGALSPNVPDVVKQYGPQIQAAAEKTGVPASLLAAQMLQESGGDPNAKTINPDLGLPDVGLMQVDQATFQGLQADHPDLKGQDIANPATNILAAAYLDQQLLQQNNGNVSAALTAYNGDATSGYAEQVLAKQQALEQGTKVPGF